MKAKHIGMNIRRKINAWIESIEEITLRNQVRNNVIVTGGSIASMLLGEDVNDYDVYFRDRQTALQVAEYYIKKWNKRRSEQYEKFKGLKNKGRPRGVPVPVFIENRSDDRIKIIVKSAGIVSENNYEGGDIDYDYYESNRDYSYQDMYLEKAASLGSSVGDVMEHDQDITEISEDCNPEDLDKVYEGAQNFIENLATVEDYRPVFLSNNAIMLKGRIQLIFRFFGEPDEIHDNYDFVHCTNYWTSWGGLQLKPEALEALLAKELRYVGSKYPVCSVFRIRKFLERGYTINAGNMFKICWQISQLDLSNKTVLEDQLVGVDSAYFQQLLTALNSGAAANQATVDETYLMALIDKIF